MSLAVMVAAYAGHRHLNIYLVCLIIVMYSFYTAVFGEAVFSHMGHLNALYAQLLVLAESTQLSLVGQYAVDNSIAGERLMLLGPFTTVSFFITNGFVIYAYKKLNRQI